jgi:predicted NodU family carbamoyl transferase
MLSGRVPVLSVTDAAKIYATSEERKQRNRQAQAAFRERRTEYIKQLEETIRVHETNLHNLQTAHRSAADECLMLRYKNSLLERILLEKGWHCLTRCLTITDFSLRHRCPRRAASKNWQSSPWSYAHATQHSTDSYRSTSHHEQIPTSKTI